MLGMIFSISLSSYAQLRHGPSAKISYGPLEKVAFGAGYHFTSIGTNDWGWFRPGYNIYAEYVPEFKALGLSAAYQYTFIFIKAGVDANVRTRSDVKKPYFSFMPNVGIDLIALDLSVGPEFYTQKFNDKAVAFKISLKVHPTLFSDKTYRQRFTKKNGLTQ